MAGRNNPAVEVAAEALAPLPEEQRIAFAISLLKGIYTPSSAQNLMRLGRAANDLGAEMASLQFLEGHAYPPYSPVETGRAIRRAAREAARDDASGCLAGGTVSEKVAKIAQQLFDVGAEFQVDQRRGKVRVVQRVSGDNADQEFVLIVKLDQKVQ